MRHLLLTLIFAIVFSVSAYSVDKEGVNQVSRMTRLPAGRVAKMAESIEKKEEATGLIRRRMFKEGYALLESITVENGFSKRSADGALYYLSRSYKIAGDYKRSLEILKKMANNDEGWKRTFANDDIAEGEAIVYFEKSGDKARILKFIESIKKDKKNLLPPKGFELEYFARIIRLYEMIGDVDQAQELTAKYLSHYFSPEMMKLSNGILEDRRAGLQLLKEALLRDKQEGKNIYAQELINTTDYFGFV